MPETRSPAPRRSAGPRRAAPAGTVLAGARTVLRTPLTGRAWAEAAHCLAGLPLAALGFAPVLVLLAAGFGLLVSIVGAVLGALLMAASLGLSRGFGAAHRGLTALLLRERIPAPPPVERPGGMFSRLDARLRDRHGWRCLAYVLLKLPLAALGWYAVMCWAIALFDLTALPRWAFALQRAEGGARVGPPLTPLPFGEPPQFPVASSAVLTTAVGLGLLVLAPWLTRLVVMADRRLARELLGPGTLAQRVRDLEETRALAVDDAAAVLRRVERDLHDGAQVRLVALAMSLDMIRERLGPADGPLDRAGLRRLVDTAHHNATEAVVELRDLARGLHPPVLDDGLPDALATLAARSSVPVRLAVDVPRRPTAAIETIAYFCAAELLANAIKHSGARRAELSAVAEGGLLRLRLTDDGRGGARQAPGGGLDGLAQRVRTVDGALDVDSPDGGPTAVTVELPMRA
ncbi:sensor histidine kinase [Streptomyces sp. NPDC050560]|uniref:sensor histidine kinase n=1 Tax=Streptomyces sp. NPDC050560 TaxID=3365630 RepID=UPI003787E115